jgi:hypothetical protein
MLGDAVYETARSANSQYLNLLTISATQGGLVFGIGEFLVHHFVNECANIKRLFRPFCISSDRPPVES